MYMYIYLAVTLKLCQLGETQALKQLINNHLPGFMSIYLHLK